MKKILLVSPLLSLDAPQPTRFRNLIKNWETHIEIHVTTYNTPKSLNLTIPSNHIHTLNFMFLGKLLILSRLKLHHKKNGSESSKKSLKNLIIKILSYLYRKLNINKWFFPDVFIIEKNNLKKNLLKLIIEIRPKTVILSASPFTLMLFSKIIKKKFPNIQIIFDVGDPLFGNSNIRCYNFIRSYMAKYYERKYLKFIDLLVVPSELLKKHYELHFKKLIDNKIKVVEQGIDVSRMKIKRNYENKKNDKLTLVYAGSFYKSLREPKEFYKAIQKFDDNTIRVKLYGMIRPDLLPPTNDNKFFYGGLISFPELAIEYQLADILVFIDNKNGSQIPGKAYELIATNKPILYIYHDKNSPSFDLFNKYDGCFISKNNYLEIYSVIAKYLKGEYCLSYNFNFESFSWENLAKKYLSFFK